MRKRCPSCDLTKSVTEFYALAAMRDGLMRDCKECHKSAVKQRRRIEGEKVREYDRTRGRRQSAESVKAYRLSFPLAYRAHNAVSNGLRDGKLRREPCLFCEAERVHAHHRDYTRPLDVIWLCPKCHHRLHANFPETAAHEPKHDGAA